MAVEKSVVKAAFAHDLGCGVDDDLEAANKDVLRATGRVQASRMLEALITTIISKLVGDMDSEDPPFRHPEDYAKCKQYLGMCLAQALTLSKKSDNIRLQMEGKVMAFQHTIKRLSKIKVDEESKAKAQIEAMRDGVTRTPDGRPPSRLTGMHPGQSIAQLRRAEAAKAAKANEGGDNGKPLSAKKSVKKPRKKKVEKNWSKKKG